MEAKLLAETFQQNFDQQKLEIFFKRSRYAAVFEKSLILGLQHLMPGLWQRLCDPAQECSLYFVSSKNGLLEIPLLQQIIRERGSAQGLSLACQGSSTAMRKKFYQHAENAELEKLITEYQVVRLEDPFYEKPKADLSLVPYPWLDITSWKNTPQEHNVLVKLRDNLHDHGVGMLVFPYQAGDGLFLLEPIKSLFLPIFIFGESVVEELIDLKIRHQAYVVETMVDTESCFQQGDFCPNKEGEQLLSYLLQVEWSTLSPDMKKQIGEKITELATRYNKRQIILQYLYIWIFPGTPHKRDLERVSGEW